MKRAFGLSALLLLAIGSWAAMGNQPALRHHLMVARVVTTPMTVAQLTDAADIVAMVRPTGNNWAHWNSTANAAWDSSDERLPMIYNDQEVSVVELFRGTVADRLTIRNIGGTVGDTAFELEGLDALAPGSVYLVFLESVQTPTREGWEMAVSFVGQEEGVFLVTNSGNLENAYGRSVKLSDLRTQ